MPSYINKESHSQIEDILQSADLTFESFSEKINEIYGEFGTKCVAQAIDKFKDKKQLIIDNEMEIILMDLFDNKKTSYIEKLVEAEIENLNNPTTIRLKEIDEEIKEINTAMLSITDKEVIKSYVSSIKSLEAEKEYKTYTLNNPGATHYDWLAHVERLQATKHRQDAIKEASKRSRKR